MRPFYELVPQKKCAPLTKQQICSLRGGKFHGEWIFVSVDFGRELGYAVYEARVKNQMRSQKPPAHPEGYLWLKSELHKNAWDFRYDIARGECAVPFFDSWWPGKINRAWRDFPAVVLQPPGGSDDMILLRRQARAAEARVRLYHALMHHPESLPAAAELLAEALGLQSAHPSDADPAKRMLRCIPYADAQLADNLRGAIMTQGPSPLPAETFTAAA